MSRQANITAACRIIGHRVTMPESFQPAAEYWLLRKGHTLISSRNAEGAFNGHEVFKVESRDNFPPVFGTGSDMPMALASLVLQVGK